MTNSSEVINATKANYIKLGCGGDQTENCLNENIITLGFHEAKHEEKYNQKFGDIDKEEIRKIYKNLGKTKKTCTDNVRQIKAFYESDENTLWFTFAKGRLWWCFAKKGVIDNHNNANNNYSRYLKTTDKGWSDKDREGNKLRIEKLNGNLTQIVGYRGTICTLKNDRFQYLINRINKKLSAEITEAEQNKTNILSSITKMLKLLNPKDFELLVELIFANSGWKRESANGETQKDIDMFLYLPSLEQTAAVQVKSKTSQNELTEYEAILEKHATDNIFYVYHTPEQELQKYNDKVKIICGNKLANMVLEAGLFDWLLKKAR